MKYRYAKIPYSAAVDLGIAQIRHRIVTGEVIINESDVQCFCGSEPFEKKIELLGGSVLTNSEAKSELKNNKL